MSQDKIISPKEARMLKECEEALKDISKTIGLGNSRDAFRLGFRMGYIKASKKKKKSNLFEEKRRLARRAYAKRKSQRNSEK